MLKIYKSTEERLQGITLLMLEKGSWLNLVNPTAEELDAVAAAANVPEDFLKAALDEEERPRIEIEKTCILIVTDIPVMLSRDSYETLPLGIVVTPDYLITVCLRYNEILAEFTPENAKSFSTFKKTRFLFQILYKSAILYLKYVIQINRLTDEIEKDLLKSMRNEEIFQLLELEKSLTFFGASLKSNRIVLERLMRLRNSSQLTPLIKIYEEDEDLLEDVIIENKQAIEMVEMYSHILSGMMATFTSIISNNINRVMKFFTAMTIVLAIPTMISGLFGMNLTIPIPGENSFLYVLIFSAVVTGIVAIGLWKRGLF